MNDNSASSSSLTISPLRRWSIVTLLCVAFIVAYFDRQNLSFALTVPDFKAFFKITELERGWLNSAFFWSYTLLQVPAGWLIDRYGVKRPFAACFLIWSAVSGLTAWTTNTTQLFLLRLFLGAGEAVNTPAGIRWIRLNFPSSKHGFVMGLYQASAKIGPALGAPLSAWLLHAYGWQVMFMVLGFGALVWLLPWLLLVKDNDRELEKTVIVKTETGMLSFKQLMSNRVTWGIIIGSFCYQYFNYFCLLDLPSYFAERWKLKLSDNGLYTGFSYLGFAIVAIVSGYAADYFIRKGHDLVKVRKLFICGGLLIASTELLGAFVDSQSLALAIAVFSLSGLGLATGNYWALTPAMLPGAPAGRLAAIQNTAANLPGVVVPLLTAYLRRTTGGWEAPLIAVFVFLLVGIASYVFLVRKEYAPK
ncbi:MAG: MFS transporter [Acidobacteria bacterium]|nr:MFS transporter [Acidobacteriota bacterium]